MNAVSSPGACSGSLDEYVDHQDDRCTVASVRNATMQRPDESEIIIPTILDVTSLLSRRFQPRTMLLTPILTTHS